MRLGGLSVLLLECRSRIRQAMRLLLQFLSEPERGTIRRMVERQVQCHPPNPKQAWPRLAASRTKAGGSCISAREIGSGIEGPGPCDCVSPFERAAKHGRLEQPSSYGRVWGLSKVSP